MMNRRKLLELIEQGENLNVEFKQRFSTHEKIAKEFIAFANTRGGFVIFGIDDNKSVYGVESEKGEAELIKITAEEYCEPPVDYKIYYINIDNKEVVVVEIFESDKKPHRIQDYLEQLDLNTSEVFVRVNDKSVPASKEMIKIMQTQSKAVPLKKYQIGKNEQIAFDFLDKHETITVKQLSEVANLSRRRASRTLIKLVRANLLLIHTKENGEDYFTYAG